MKRQGNGYMVLVVMTALGLALAGCAALQKNSVTDVEGLLLRAGFTQRTADTPEKLAHLKSLPQHQFFPHQRDGQKYILYADAAYCNCLYVGNETNLEHYHKLEIQQNQDPTQLLNRPDIVTGEEWSDIWGPSK